jgi:hypothetical protein
LPARWTLQQTSSTALLSAQEATERLREIVERFFFRRRDEALRIVAQTRAVEIGDELCGGLREDKPAAEVRLEVPLSEARQWQRLRSLA